MMLAGTSLSGNERNCCFLNTGSRSTKFANISACSGLDFRDDSRALATVDWDHDGDLDLWVSNRTGPRARFLRNDTATDHHFVAVRLKGRQCNRDAIGARVEVVLRNESSDLGSQISDLKSQISDSSATRHYSLIKTLRAGEGFLGQSSKWLHFGLGRAHEIQKLIIRWPDGEATEFRDVQADQHYRIVQGREDLRLWSPPARSLQLTPGSTEPPDPRAQARIWLASRLPCPTLEYLNPEGASVSFSEYRGTPVLLNLWASWCGPCLEELSDFRDRHSELRATGLEIVAVSVDSISPQEGSDGQAAGQLVEDLKLPFATGTATDKFVNRLQSLHDALIDVHRPLPVPSSFLIDPQGRLAVIYKGPVEVEHVLSDVGKLELDDDTTYIKALPFTGVWMRPPRQPLDLVGWEFVDQGNFDEAFEYVSGNFAMLARDKQFWKFIYYLGEKLFDKGKWNDAATMFRQATELNPKYVMARVKLGLALARQGRIDEAAKNSGLALDNYTEAIELTPDDAETYFNRGTAYEILEQYDSALNDYTKAIELKPKYVEAYSNRGLAYQHLGRHELALSDFDRAIELRPDYADAYFNRGITYQKLGKYQLALDDYDRAIELKPDFAKPFFSRGIVYAQLGKYDLALADFLRSIELNPDNANAYCYRGIAYAESGKHDLALADYAQAIKLKPDLALAYYSRGRAHVRLRQFDRALTDYDKAIELQPDYLDAYSNRGITYVQLGRYELSLADFNRAVELNPENPQPYNNLARLLATCPDSQYRDSPLAIAAAQRACELSEWNNFKTLTTLAAAYAQAGQFAEAVKWQTKAVELAPTRAKDHLRRDLKLYENRGRSSG